MDLMWVVHIIDGLIGVHHLMFIVLVRSIIPERNQIMMFCRQMHDDAVTGYKSMKTTISIGNSETQQTFMLSA